MPVGWTASPAAQFERRMHEGPDLSVEAQWSLIGLLVGLFGLIASMPKFDGWGAGDWGREEEDGED